MPDKSVKQLQAAIETERLSMIPLQPGYGSFILELVNTEGWLQFIGDRNVHSVYDAENYIEKISSNTDVLYWIVLLKPQRKAIGIITLIKRSELPYPDLGFAFLPAFSGKGYAFEACVEVLHHIQRSERPTIPFLCAVTVPANKTSICLLSKLGFIYIEERTIGKDTVHMYGAGIDKILVSLVVQSFFGVFTNTQYRRPEMEKLTEICLPEVLFVNKKATNFEIMNLTSLSSSRERILTNGALLEFEEEETFAETKIAEGIAQRYSSYTKKGILEGRPFETDGFKFFQLVKSGHDWKIASVVWTDVV